MVFGEPAADLRVAFAELVWSEGIEVCLVISRTAEEKDVLTWSPPTHMTNGNRSKSIFDQGTMAG